jgi:hypothetical protein
MKIPNYVGLDQDCDGGLTSTGKLIRDAWVFALLPETETCTGWNAGQLQELYDRVTEAWEPYGHLASALPAELRERHQRIYTEAIARARANGWDPERYLDADH